MRTSRCGQGLEWWRPHAPKGVWWGEDVDVFTTHSPVSPRAAARLSDQPQQAPRPLQNGLELVVQLQACIFWRPTSSSTTVNCTGSQRCLSGKGTVTSPSCPTSLVSRPPFEPAELPITELVQVLKQSCFLSTIFCSVMVIMQRRERCPGPRDGEQGMGRRG